jgi:hypothetical protein
MRIVAAAVAAIGLVNAQSPKFEVASIKPSQSESDFFGIRPAPVASVTSHRTSR